MTTLASTVTSTFPTSGSSGFLLSTPIKITLGLKIDEEQPILFLEGADTDKFIGDNRSRNLRTGDASKLLDSPGRRGSVPFKLKFNRVSGNSQIEVIPDAPLSPETDYRLVLSGVFKQTVTDPDGETVGPKITGKHSMVSGIPIAVLITEEGAPGVAKFTYSINGVTVGPLTVNMKKRAIEQNLSLKFQENRFYEAGESWEYTTIATEELTGGLTVTFRTGNGALESPPEEASTLITGLPAPTVVSSSNLSILKTEVIREVSVLDEIRITCSEDMTGRENDIKVNLEPFIGHPNLDVPGGVPHHSIVIEDEVVRIIF